MEAAVITAVYEQAAPAIMAGKRPQMKYGKLSLANIAAPSGGRRRAAKQPIVCSFSCIARYAVWLSTCHEGQAHTANVPVLQMHYPMSCPARSSLLAQGKNPPETPIRIHNGKRGYRYEQSTK